MIGKPHRKKARPLCERLLVHLAEKLGPSLDVLDVTDYSGLKVRDLILHFAKEMPPASPAEVRAALLELHDAKHAVSCGLDARPGPDGVRPASVMSVTSEVRITCRGLVAARKVSPGCGRSVSRLTLRTRRASPLLDVRFGTEDATSESRVAPSKSGAATGGSRSNKERDAMLNASPTIAAVAFIVLVEQPTLDRPLLVEECAVFLERLDLYGLRKRPGPKADQVASADAIRDALKRLGKVLNVARGYFDEDKRRDFYFVSGPLPEVRIEAGDRRHFGDWDSFRHVLWRILHGETLATIPGVNDILFPHPINAPKESKAKVARTKPKAAGSAKTRSAVDASNPKPKLIDAALGKNG